MKLLVVGYALVVASLVGVPTVAVAAWGPDGNSPMSCSGSPSKAVTLYDSRGGTAVVASQVQLRGSSCFYGVNWTRHCAKLWYSIGYTEINRHTATQNPPGTQSYSSGWNYTNSQCTGYVAWRVTPVVFNNCAAANMGVCRAGGIGQVWQSGVFLDEGWTDSV